MATVTSDISAAALLGRFRGSIADAGLTYPERAAIDVVDGDGGEWHLTTWWADYTPADPGEFTGKSVVSADLGETPGKLTVGFSDGSTFVIIPAPDEGDDAIESWELFPPDGMVLIFGPYERGELIPAGGRR